VQHIAVLQRFEKVRPQVQRGSTSQDTRFLSPGARKVGSYRVAVPAAGQPLTPDQLVELRDWAATIVGKGATGDLGELARTIVPLADEAALLREALDAPPSVPPGDLERVRVRAELLVANGAAGEVRAAARAVLLLCDDIAARRAATPKRSAPRRRIRLYVVAAAAAVGALLLTLLVFRGGSGPLEAKGPTESMIGKDALNTLAFSVAGTADEASDFRWSLDGTDVTARARPAGDRIVFRPRALADGRHTVEVTRGRSNPPRSASWMFTLDTVAPTIRVTRGSLAATRGAAYGIHGVVEHGTSLHVNGGRVAVGVDGRFAALFQRAPTRAVILLAQDAAGNTTDSRLVVSSAPRLPANPVRAVHVSADAWADAGLRGGILALLAQHRINAVELDLKDESGIIGWDSRVPLARRIGAQRRTFDLGAAVKLLHARGARVIGRLVAFRDPVLAQWAWTHGHRNLVVQAPDGTAYSGGYGGFTNFANSDVQKYNVDIAEAAARAGVDDVLYDYVRRPDGPTSSMVVPGLVGDPADAIVAFLRRSRTRLEPHGTFLGASVFGIAVTRPDEIAQDVPAIAREVDYVAPLVYPSHWGPYEYGVANPDAQPFAIVRRSLKDFQRSVRGTGARLVPWLQDFSLDVQYGPKQVSAQIDAARAAGVDEFILWDPNVTYTSKALDRTAPTPTTGILGSAKGSSELVALRPSISPDAPVASGLEPNELGTVPVLMYHQLLPGGGSEYDLMPDEFRAELERLWRGHYRPITASAFVRGTIDVPRGTTPVVLTFDDSTTSQAGLLADGSLDPDSAVGIMLDFTRAHPEFRPAGTLYVNGSPFGGDPRDAELARRLVAAGFELGNHTFSHARLDELDDDSVQREIVLDQRVIHALLPGAKIATMALPYGLLPQRPELALRGSWDDERYRFAGAFLAGAEPAPSPFGSDFDPGAIPRIRSDPADLLNGSSDWLRRLKADPGDRYVSDGDPRRITFPSELASRLDDRFSPRANPTG
jgi:hypothetical protein